jgi:NAD(P)-dependent dehydrogenase (short-subunit alcohol dehydrogenase family)
VCSPRGVWHRGCEEVAQLVLTLASDRTGNVVGADFVIDGGLITTL